MAIGTTKVDKWTRPWEIERFDNLSVRDERFFSIVIKGCLGWLTRHIIMYNKPIKHFIFNTGTSYMYVESNGYDYSWNEVSGEDWMYMQTPRCIVNMQEISVQMEELSNPFVMGIYERQSEDGNIKGYSAEMRRLPIEMTLQLQYVLSNFNEYIILIQELFDQLIFQRYFRINYLGQIVDCSIEFPNTSQLQQNKIDLATTDDKNKTVDISIKIKTSYPIINVDTEISASQTISSFASRMPIESNGVISDNANKNIN